MKQKDRPALSQAEWDAWTEDFENLPKESSKVDFIPELAFLCLGFLYLPISYGLGLANFSSSQRLFGGDFLKPIYAWAVYWSVIHWLLLRPLHRYAIPSCRTFSSRLLRWFLVTTLIAAPLLSYAIFRSALNDAYIYVELALAIIPSSVLAMLLLFTEKKSMVSSFCLALSTYVPLFLVNDLLGGIPTYFSYATTGTSFYYVRTLSPLIAILGYLLLMDANSRRASRSELEAAGWGLMLYFLVAHVGIPLALKQGISLDPIFVFSCLSCVAILWSTIQEPKRRIIWGSLVSLAAFMIWVITRPVLSVSNLRSLIFLEMVFFYFFISLISFVSEPRGWKCDSTKGEQPC